MGDRYKGLVWLILCVVAMPSYALKADRKAPVRLDADRVDIDEQSQVSTYQGSVHFVQGSFNLWADTLLVYRKNGGMDRIEAKGSPARLTVRLEGDAQDARLRARRIQFFSSDGVIRLTGDAYMWRDGDEFSGYVIHYDEALDKVMAHSDAAGSGRVRVIIQPKTQPKTGADDGK